MHIFCRRRAARPGQRKEKGTLQVRAANAASARDGQSREVTQETSGLVAHEVNKENALRMPSCTFSWTGWIHLGCALGHNGKTVPAPIILEARKQIRESQNAGVTSRGG